MLSVFGILGLLQVTLLPALIILKAAKLRGGIIERLLYLFPLSLTANYLLVFLLTALHLYTRPVMLGIIFIEILCILLLYRKTLLQGAGPFFSGISAALQRELQPLSSFLTGKPAGLQGWIRAVSGCFALSGIFWAFHLCRLNIGTVFSGWDTLFSWNTYAESWASGSIPQIGGMYPQLVTANWSVSYLLQGDGAIQFFNTLLPPLFFLMIQVMLFDLGFQRGESGFFLAAIIARFMMKKLMGDQLFDGYMDVPAAAMSLLSIYTFLKGENRSVEEGRQALVLGVLFAAAAAVTKQSGIPALVLAPLAIRVLLPEAARTFTRRQKLLLCAAALLIVLPWYLFCLFSGNPGTEKELIAEGIMDFNRQFGISERLRLAAATLGKYSVCFLFSLVALPFLPKKYRLLFFLMAWPLTAVWAVSYSYDARNLGPVLPFISLMCGLGLSGIGSCAARLISKAGAGRIPVWLIVLLMGAAAAAAAVYLLPDTRLTEDQRRKQQALFGEQLNRELLYGILGETHEGQDLYTDYPAWFLSGYRDCCSAADLTDAGQVRSVLEGTKINWLLLPEIMPNNSDPSKELIEQCIRDGRCQLQNCSDGYYKSYCLYRIQR